MQLESLFDKKVEVVIEEVQWTGSTCTLVYGQIHGFHVLIALGASITRNFSSIAYNWEVAQKCVKRLQTISKRVFF